MPISCFLHGYGLVDIIGERGRAPNEPCNTKTRFRCRTVHCSVMKSALLMDCTKCTGLQQCSTVHCTLMNQGCPSRAAPLVRHYITSESLRSKRSGRKIERLWQARRSKFVQEDRMGHVAALHCPERIIQLCNSRKLCNVRIAKFVEKVGIQQINM